MDETLKRDLDAERNVKVSLLAKAAGTAPNTLYQAIARGEVKAVRIGKAVRIPAHEARRLLGLGKVEAP